ncbi:ABC transporter permease subunit [Actinoplanes sp. NPDC051851]|uniref:ABC transporter permease subunit n=1 Tax=Actinoplanes sp. NPDC051851 TaxID=3154753 RepID=UPI003442FF75
MIWLTWRQYRTPALSTGGLLLLFLLALAATWTRITDLARSTGLTGCSGTACDRAATTFLQELDTGPVGPVYVTVAVALLLLPALFGTFWGAPLVARELETGTYRLIFSQTVSRGRWLLVKLLVGGASAAFGAGLVALLLTRWAAPIDTARGDRISPLTFAVHGVVPIGYAALAFVIGVTAGLLLRRIVPAMAVTLLLVAAVQVAMPLLVRPVLATSVTSITALDAAHPSRMSFDTGSGAVHVTGPAAMPNAWILENTTITADGAEFAGPAPSDVCGPESGGPEKCQEWLAAQNLRQKVVSVPGAQFWALQWRELGLLLAAAVALALCCLWRIRRKLA